MGKGHLVEMFPFPRPPSAIPVPEFTVEYIELAGRRRPQWKLSGGNVVGNYPLKMAFFNCPGNFAGRFSSGAESPAAAHAPWQKACGAKKDSVDVFKASGKPGKKSVRGFAGGGA